MTFEEREARLEAELQATARAAGEAQARQDAELATLRAEERRVCRREYQRGYTKRPAVKARRRRYTCTPEFREARNAQLKAEREVIRQLKAHHSRIPSLHALPMEPCSSDSPQSIESPHSDSPQAIEPCSSGPGM